MFRTLVTFACGLLLVSGSAQARPYACGDPPAQNTPSDKLRLWDDIDAVGPVTICLDKKDYEILLAFEISGVDPGDILNAKNDVCATMPIPRLTLVEIYQSFVTLGGEKYTFVKALDCTRTQSFYLQLRTEDIAFGRNGLKEKYGPL